MDFQEVKQLFFIIQAWYNIIDNKRTLTEGKRE